MNASQLQSLVLFAVIIMVSVLRSAGAATVDPPCGDVCLLTSSSADEPVLGSGDTGLVPTTTDPHGKFDNDWYFSLTSPSKLKGDALSINFAGFDIKGLKLELIDTTTNTDYFLSHKFTLAGLPAGDYELIVTGDATGKNGGVYSGAITAVPLPAAAWLLLSGLVGVGVIARRRRADDEG